MAEKSKMKCNSPKRSDRAGKKMMVKACSGGHIGIRARVLIKRALRPSDTRWANLVLSASSH